MYFCFQLVKSLICEFIIMADKTVNSVNSDYRLPWIKKKYI